MKAQIVSGEFCLCPNTPTENKFIINMSNTTAHATLIAMICTSNDATLTEDENTGKPNPKRSTYSMG